MFEPARPVATSALDLGSRGLTVGGVALLGADDRGGLALTRDAERCRALLAIAANRPMAADEILPSLTAVADHWRRGDNVLAGLRLAFSPLQKVFDQTASLRIGLAARLLDDGYDTNHLLAEVGLGLALTKYNRDEPRVPAILSKWRLGQVRDDGVRET